MSHVVVMLVTEGLSSVYLYNALKDYVKIQKVIVEEPFPRTTFLKRRIKRLGGWRVFGQILFQLLCAKPLKWFSKKRIRDIIAFYSLNDAPIEQEKRIDVKSVNSDSCLQILRELNPRIVVINGTRIISKKILQGVNAVFINIHSGITPNYRGDHGGYWSLVNNDHENCGVTVFIANEGIDTGNILYQTKIRPTSEDNFSTYPFLQLGEGIELLKKAIGDAWDNRLSPIEKKGVPSKLWHHPTIWQYLYTRWIKGVK